MILEFIVDVCAACPSDSGLGGADLLGTFGAPSSGPAPGESDIGPPDGPEDTGNDTPPDPPEESWWDRFFDSDPVVQDAAESMIQDVGTEIALDVASKRLPWASGTLGALGALVSGSQTLAEGVTVIVKNDGRGLGGSSESGKQAWDAIEQERRGYQPSEGD